MNKYDAFLIKYAEIGIKGKNRHVFEEALVRQIRIALRPCEGRFAVSRTYGRVFVEAHSDYDFDEVTEALSHVFGIWGICPVRKGSTMHRVRQMAARVRLRSSTPTFVCFFINFSLSNVNLPS